MLKAILLRLHSDDKQTLGVLSIYEALNKVFECKTLELSWVENERRVSCIPQGVYFVDPRTSEKFGNHFIVQGVPRRDAILLHPGNTYRDTEGCILCGYDYADMDNDGHLDVIKSRFVFDRLVQVAREGFLLTVVSFAENKRLCSRDGVADPVMKPNP